MITKKPVREKMSTLMFAILGGIIGGGTSLFGWLWSFLAGYQLFFAKGDWGGAALQFEKPAIFFWSMLGSACLGFLGGALSVLFNKDPLSFMVEPKGHDHENLANLFIAFMFLSWLPAVVVMVVSAAILIGLGYAIIFTIKRIRYRLAKKKRPQRIKGGHL